MYWAGHSIKKLYIECICLYTLELDLHPFKDIDLAWAQSWVAEHSQVFFHPHQSNPFLQRVIMHSILVLYTCCLASSTGPYLLKHIFGQLFSLVHL